MSMSPTKRRDMDVMKLMMSNYDVKVIEDGKSTADFCVEFHGPEETAYEGGIWHVHVGLPMDYPYRSPSIGFLNRLYHPNVDETSGSVCLDVINQTWSPMYELVNIFDSFLPQLLRYPNPSDPLNGEAAALLLRDPDAYTKRVKEYVKKHATREALSRAVAQSASSSSEAQNGDSNGVNGDGKSSDADNDDLSSLSSSDSCGAGDTDFKMDF